MIFSVLLSTIQALPNLGPYVSVTGTPTPIPAPAGTIVPFPTPNHSLFPISSNDRCGPSFNTRCDPSECCSSYGWCGVTADHCNAGCQGLFGHCNFIFPTDVLPPIPTDTVSAFTRFPTPTVSTSVLPTTSVTVTTSLASSAATTTAVPASSSLASSAVTTTTATSTAPVSSTAPEPTQTALDPSKKAAVISTCNRPGVFALTFDDGPYEFTPKLLDILREKQVKATFFVNGKNWGEITTEANKGFITRMHNEGHHIGSHTHKHANLSTLSVNEMWNEMKSLDDALKSIIGVRPVFMRPPYGVWNDQVLTAMGSWGYRVSWINVDTKDTVHKGQPNAGQLSVDQITTAIDKNATNTGFISLSHDTVKETVEEFAAKAIDSIRAKGLQLVTLGDCVGAPPSEWYRA